MRGRVLKLAVIARASARTTGSLLVDEAARPWGARIPGVAAWPMAWRGSA